MTSDTSDFATFSALLGHMPDISGTQEDVYVIDFARVRELYHIALPETDEGLHEYVWAFTGGKIPRVDPGRAAWLSGIHSYYRVSPVGDYLAFDARNADSSIVAAPAEDHRRVFEVVTGRYDPDATRRAIAQCSEECEPFTLDIHEGVEFYIAGEDYSGGGLLSRHKPPFNNHVGKGGRIAVTESHVYRTFATQDMKDMLEAVSGFGRSLADDENMALAAAALDGLDVYAGSIRTNVERFSVRHYCSYGSESEEAECVRDMETKLGGLLDEYEVLGVGFGKDEDGPFIGVSLIYADEDSAKSNATVFGNMLEFGESLQFENMVWRETFPRSEVKSDGRAVIARLSVSNPYGNAPWAIIYTDEGLFYYR